MNQAQPSARRRASLSCMLGLALSVALPAALPSTAQAQAWPTKVVRIVVGGPAGGTADILGRLLAEGLTQSLGKPVIVEQKPGGAGAIAVNTLLSAPHDGHTLLLIQGGIVSETPLALKVSFDPFKDLKPVAQVARTGLVLVGNPKLPAKNFSELLAYIKSKPGQIDYASYAAGMRGQTIGVQFNRLAGVDMKHVGYKGSPPALQDVMGGHVPLMFDGLATSLPLIKSGKLKAYAVAYPKRIPALPDVPTFAEVGFPAMTEPGWMGVWLPPDVPAAVQEKIRNATLAIVQQPGYRERVEAMGMDAGQPLSSEALSRDARAAHERQAELLRSIHFVPE
ncbi:Tripartite-type tricarboxylate transporter, extracytoplasmic receptor component TctC [Cupriavidus necator]|uniref:Probable extra-cytoplasmic solute receptor n=1 Tax=Cupriavidus necator (strain ATCC 17699 / DSM 428 / KCTC 22496 / NCIMB 10442 / H16 / Stanier 337) TaxID=381666 RepID=Q0K2H7_CUPNH|nr:MULTISPECIES: tripartite tricarboxylate transporter substrate binding protein [Cupriavidus]EON21103.1 extra-cytoplasmic solute receptor [Cupriavidus sp. GA3-3]KUE85606.1 ABC transporter substrate-binding protein [Cupriavidus necator]QCC03683.1 tripartite tricarboxylate transporter substrate binding protein [Cupriavidus necator H16]QQB80740.1 tripartite tricarboxylate transporter substrate binding protein [Cupriavidus necator]WKA45033.1 tripartite tricarboxylate transporter substrate binding